MDTKALYSKLALVPAPIKEWLGSEQVIEEIEKMERQFILPTGSAAVIAKLLQRIQIEDLHPEYFSGELSAQLNLEKDKAVHITAEVKKNIFTPIKDQLTKIGINIDLLDQFQPIVAAKVEPKIIQDIDASPLGVTGSSSVTIYASPTIIGVPPEPSTTTAAKPTPTVAPKPLSDVGWSKTQPTGPVVKLDTSLVPPTAPAGNAQPKPVQAPSAGAPSASATPVPHATIGEFERLNMVKKDGAQVPGAPAEDPAPVMLHHDTTFSAAQKNSSFTLERPGAGAEVTMTGTRPGPSIPKPAVLELGNTPGNVPKPASSASQVVHYTDYKAPLASVPTATSGPRNVTQIVPPAPQVPVPPKPPAPPVPPVPSVPQPPQPPRPPQQPSTPANNTQPASGQKNNKDKVIVKNFL